MKLVLNVLKKMKTRIYAAPAVKELTVNKEVCIDTGVPVITVSDKSQGSPFSNSSFSSHNCILLIA